MCVHYIRKPDKVKTAVQEFIECYNDSMRHLLPEQLHVSKPKLGFTLIELLVVTSLTVMLMLTATSVFLTFFISEAQTEVIGDITDEGDYAISQMEFLLRNAVELVPNVAGNVCHAGMTQLRLKSFDNEITTLGRRTDSNGDAFIASNSARLTSDNVTLSDPADIPLNGNPVFRCRQSEDKTVTSVETIFYLEKPAANFQDGSQINRERFNTTVTIRTR